MSPPPKGRDQRLSTEVKVERLHVLHFAILERLPDEGSTLGWLPATISVRLLRDQLNAERPESALTSSFVGTELRNLRALGLAIRVEGSRGSTLGWQRTQRAVDLLNEQKGDR